MSRWFRLYDCLLDDPKVQRLPGDLFKAWVNLLCVASRHGGKLPANADIAFLLRVSEEAVATTINDLMAVGLIDQEGDDRTPHNWHSRQHSDGTAAERMRRYRNAQRNDDRNADRNGDRNVTPVEQIQIQSTEQNRTERRLKARLKPAYTGEFEMLWSVAPKDHPGSKLEAFKAFQRLDEADQDAALNGLMAYADEFAERKRLRPDTQQCHVSTFLNQRRWESYQEAAE